MTTDDLSMSICIDYGLPPNNDSLTIPLKNARCRDGSALSKGGLVALTDGSKYLLLLNLRDSRVPAIGGDLGLAINVMDRSGDDEGARYFEGASFYYSLTSLKTDRWRLVANLSALDFDDEIDFETGVGFGVLYRASPNSKPNDGSFTISIVRGYNLMADDDIDPYYTMIGFGWSFGRAN